MNSKSSLLTLLLKSFKKNPAQIAVSSGSQRITYAQLDQLSKKYADYIQQITTNRQNKNSIIALFYPKNPQQIAALIGIIRSGHAYLPIDIDTPQSRIKHILKESSIQLLITNTKASASRVSKISPKLKVITPSALNNLKKSCKGTVEANNKDLLSIIYTSGSTGMSKGVMLTHKSIYNRIKWFSKNFPLTESDRILQKTPITFDVSIAEILWPLCTGGQLIIEKKTVLNSPEALTKAIHKNQITHIHFVPSMLSVFVNYVQANKAWKKIKTLKVLFSSGENLSKTLAKKASKLGVEIFNLYGPSETGEITCQKFSVSCNNEPDSVPIGKPIDNTRIYILDEQLRPLPENALGELYISGLSLSKGYINQPDLTKTCFLKNPYKKSDEKQYDKIYKTGDLVRFNKKSGIQFIGRKDEQINRFGYRIEKKEIEQALLKVNKIETAYIVFENQILYAFYKLKEQEKLAEAEAKTHIKEHLMPYMIPDRIIQIEAIPLTKHGKIDKKALLSSTSKNQQHNKKSVRLSENEQYIIEACKKLTGNKKIKPTDNFFTAGGHSLLAIQLSSQIKKDLGEEISISTIYNANSLADISKTITIRKKSKKTITAKKIIHDEKNRYKPFELTDIQRAYLIGRSNSLNYGNTPTLDYMELFFYNLDIEKLEKALNETINNHDQLRAIILANGKQVVLKKAPHYKIDSYKIKETSKNKTKGSLNLIHQKMLKKIKKVDQFPLFQIAASKQKEKYCLHILLDAIIFDITSVMIFLKELSARYHGKTPSNKAKITFRDYVCDLPRQQNTKKYKAHKKYWINQIASIPLGPQLPIIKKATKTNTFSHIEASIDKLKWKKIKKLAKQYKSTPAMVLLTLFIKTIRLWSLEPDFSLNLTLYNRPQVHENIDKIIGDFTNTLILACNNQDLFKTSFLNDIEHIKQKFITDAEHIDYSGIDLQKELMHHHGIFDKPLFPIVFSSALNISDNYEKEIFEKEFVGYGKRESSTSQVLIDCQVSESNNTLLISWDFLKNEFPEGMITDMFSYYLDLINSSASQNWSSPLAHFSQTKYVEAEKIEPKRKRTDLNSNLISNFLTNAKKHPNNIAIINDYQNFTYSDLYKRAKQLASQIKTKNKILGISSTDYVEKIISCLSILLSNNAYIPLPDNLNKAFELAEKEKIHAVITGGNKEPTRNTNKVKIIKINNTNKEPSYARKKLATTTELAYVFHTSGTTGKSKGVMINHGAAVNTIRDINTRFKINSKDKIVAVSDFNFDLSVYDIFGMLSAGGSIVTLTAKQKHEPSDWLTHIDKQKITVWNTVPMLFEILLDYCEQKNKLKMLNSLRLILLSGDWLPTTLATRIKKLLPNCQLISLGGATEASIWSIYHEINYIADINSPIPYGKALSKQSIYVLNSDFEHCPINTPGEIFIAGKGVSLGYLNDPELTKSKFVYHPITNERLYKTGDLGKLNHNGDIEILGRKDNQIKIRGMRIELEGIESTLKTHPNVENAVVCIKKTLKKKNSELIAYIQPKIENGRKKKAGNHLKELKKIEKDFFKNYKNKNEVLNYNRFLENLEADAKKAILTAINKNTSKHRIIKRWKHLINEKNNNTKLPTYKKTQDTTQSLEFFNSFLSNLDELVKNKINPLSLMFPDGCIDIAEHLYQNNPIAHLNSTLLSQIINQIFHNNTEKITVLEAGAGVGGTTHHILNNLSIPIADYNYSDVSNYFFEAVKQKFQKYNFFNYKIFDINSDPQLQGFRPESFDLIIATNVIHNSTNILTTLNNLRMLLKPGGILAFTETTKSSILYEATFSFLESFGNKEKTDENIIKNKSQWINLAEKALFNSVLVLDEADKLINNFAHYVFICQKSKEESYPKPKVLNKIIKRLNHAEITPSSYHYLTSFPLTKNGKIDRNSLAKLYRKTLSPQPNNRELNTREMILSNILRQNLNIKVNNPNDNFFEIGGDSLSAIRFANALNKKTGKLIRVETIYRHKTISKLANLLDQISQTDGNESFIQTMKNGDNKKAFIFIHPSITGVDIYRNLAKKLSEHYNIYMLESYNIISPDKPLKSIHDIVHHHVDIVKANVAESEIYICGWSYGGLLANQIASMLNRKNYNIQMLILLDSVILSKDDKANILRKINQDDEALLKKSPYYQSLSPEMKSSIIQNYKIDLDIMLNYTPKKFTGPTVLIKSVDSSDDFYIEKSADNGWKSHRQDINILNTAISHYHMLDKKNIETMYTLIMRFIQEGERSAK